MCTIRVIRTSPGNRDFHRPGLPNSPVWKIVTFLRNDKVWIVPVRCFLQIIISVVATVVAGTEIVVPITVVVVCRFDVEFVVIFWLERMLVEFKDCVSDPGKLLVKFRLEGKAVELANLVFDAELVGLAFFFETFFFWRCFNISSYDKTPFFSTGLSKVGISDLSSFCEAFGLTVFESDPYIMNIQSWS